MSLAKADMEDLAGHLRSRLGLSDDEALDPFKINVTGVQVVKLGELPHIESKIKKHLLVDGAKKWSAVSIPLDADQEKWVVVLNDANEVPRQRVSLLEELWHIVQGHKLTTVVRVGTCLGRSFEAEEEHDAYYLAAATLLPHYAVKKIVSQKEDLNRAADRFGVSKDLIEYRIKRLMLWGEYKGKEISLVRAG